VSRVSYQLPPDEAPERAPGPASWRPVTRDAVVTRRRDATTTLRVELSREQARWLRRVAEEGGATPDGLVRGLVDLAMDLEIDWSSLTSARDLREALTDAVMVRIRE
jgi:hypothetical protein